MDKKSRIYKNVRTIRTTLLVEGRSKKAPSPTTWLSWTFPQYKSSREKHVWVQWTGNLDDHTVAYLDWMIMQGASNAIKCMIFPLTLVYDARTWISCLRRQSISNFIKLHKEFQSGFAGSQHSRRHIMHLTYVKQQLGESL
ncbi:hypothetical protein ACOSQ2_010499 [Xanthoceras sorbifolium]